MSSSKNVTQEEFDAFSKTTMGLIAINSTILGVLARIAQKSGVDYEGEFTDEENDAIAKASVEVIEGIVAGLTDF